MQIQCVKIGLYAIILAYRPKILLLIDLVCKNGCRNIDNTINKYEFINSFIIVLINKNQYFLPLTLGKKIFSNFKIKKK